MLWRTIIVVILFFLIFSGDIFAAELKIGTLPINDSLPLFVAQDRGLLEKIPGGMEIVTFASALERDSAFQAKRIDGYLGDIIGTAIIKSQGIDLKIISIVLGESPREGIIAIVASPKSGINKIEDLKGKSIAISTNTLIEYVLDRLLKEKGISENEIKKMDIKKIPLRLQMLLNDQISAAVLPNPLSTLAIKKGARLIIDDSGSNISQTVLVFSEDAIRKKSMNIGQFMRAYKVAIQEVNNKPEAFRDLMVRRAGLPPELKEDYNFEKFPSPRIPSEKAINEVVDWLFRKNLIKARMSFNDLVTPHFLHY